MKLVVTVVAFALVLADSTVLSAEPADPSEYSDIVKEAAEKCNTDAEDLVTFNQKIFNSTDPAVYCFAHEFCVKSGNCKSDGNLNASALLEQQTDEEIKSQLNTKISECVASKSSIKDANHRCYEELACVFNNTGSA